MLLPNNMLFDARIGSSNKNLKANQIIEESTPFTASLHKLTTKHHLSNTLYPNSRTHHAPILLESSSQLPAHNLPVHRCSYPLDSFISPAAIDDIQHAFNRAILLPNDYLLSTNRVPITSITNLAFTNLLSFDSPTPDSIIHNTLSICQKMHPSLNSLTHNSVLLSPSRDGNSPIQNFSYTKTVHNIHKWLKESLSYMTPSSSYLSSLGTLIG